MKLKLHKITLSYTVEINNQCLKEILKFNIRNTLILIDYKSALDPVKYLDNNPNYRVLETINIYYEIIKNGSTIYVLRIKEHVVMS